MNVLNVPRESLTTKRNRPLHQIVQIATKASGQKILDVPLIANSVIKVRTTIKQPNYNARIAPLGNTTWEQKRRM
jgi:hypothetical protein